RSAIRVGDAEEVEEQRQRVGRLRVQEDDRARDLPAGRIGAVLLRDAEPTAKELRDREERDRRAVRDALRLVDRDAARAAPLDELVAEPALPDARVGDDRDRAPVPPDCLSQRRLQGGRLRVAADEAREPARAGEVEARAERAGTLELVDPDGLPEPLDA